MIQRASAAMVGLALAAFGVDAGAVALNPKGLGQVLIYPYYTVNKAQDTLVSVVNVSNQGKAVELRFLEGRNSRPVLDFTLFLSPRDVWTAAVTADAAGGAKLVTHDRSCTIPALPADGVLFQKTAYAGGAAAPFDQPDGGPAGIERTREGSIELIAIGDVAAGSPTAQRITHVQSGQPGAGKPPGCAEITKTNIAADLVAPGSDLFGSGAIVNVDEGTFYPYNADAISDFTRVALYSNDPLAPSLRQANSAGTSAGAVRALVFTDKGSLALDYAKGEDAVSALFMADQVSNEYLNATDLGAATDWIVTFPTKRYYTDRALNPNAPQPPFAEAFSNGQSQVVVNARFFDQEEWYTDTDYDPDTCGSLCPSVPPATLAYAVNAVRVLPKHPQQPLSEVFGSTLSTALVPAGQADSEDLPAIGAGWARLNLNAPSEPHSLPNGVDGTSRIELFGLPAAGFMAYNIINANAQPGKLANYSGVFAHRTILTCTRKGSSPEPNDPCS